MARTYRLLEVENLNTSFKIDAGRVLAVNGVSFTLDKGEVLGIVGESGSGKSVTAYSIMGILDKNGSVDSGKIIYNGTDLCKISERQMRDIRGNRISIIFQDAMTSLNPTWTIGNQLREAILTHAKNPVKAAVYDLENAIESDEQRIVSLKKGIANHPERDYLKTDLAFVENKLVEDRKAYEEKKVQAVKDYEKLKTEKNAEIKAGMPAYRKEIFAKLKEFLTHYFEVNPYPEEEEAMKEKEAQQLLRILKKREEALETLLKEGADVNGEGLRAKLNERLIIASAKREVRHAKAMLKRFIGRFRHRVRVAPRRERYYAFKDAKRKAYEFKMELISCYKETRYSANKKALKMLNEVGITEPEKRMKQYPFELSGGMLQRAMIAMALVERPDILIADEPTTALDVTIQAQILDLLKRLQAEYGMAIIIITHDLGVVAQICDKVDIMYAGRIVERGTVNDIFYNPQHEYTKGLLKSMPKLNSKGERLEPIQGNPVDLFCLPKGCAFSARCKECMEICIEKYPEEVKYDESGHAASCWRMIKALHDAKKIDIEHGEPEGKPLVYNGAVIRNETKKGGKSNAKRK
ncbi:MAG: ATP-binding cassette domain-containing protein [Bacilli bacterium]|nr:ATP-binding cassette domain-containing protein [Bacilli bacterium]